MNAATIDLEVRIAFLPDRETRGRRATSRDDSGCSRHPG
jgi:hypothetical protein